MSSIDVCKIVVEYHQKTSNADWKSLQERNMAWRYKDTGFIIDVDVRWAAFYFNHTGPCVLLQDWDYFWDSCNLLSELYEYIDNHAAFALHLHNRNIELELNKLN